MNDLETSKRIAGGDRDAAEQFVRTHYPSVFRLMRHLTRHREDAEDLTQQAFVTARAKIDTFRGAASLRTWIHRIAFNEYAQWKRKKKQTVPLTVDHAADEPGYGSCVEGQSLLGALATLPDKHREAFVLHEIEELSVKETADVLQVPIGTVKARLFYARKGLQSFFEDGPKVKDHEQQEVTV